jgi:membrane protein YdbS with pleckstrin-like domain
MALISCPECKQQVSTDAQSCPHCGKPLSGIPAAAAGSPGPMVFAPGGAPGPEETLWEGRPAIALVFGKLVGVIIRLLIFLIIGYFAFTMGLPALASLSSGAKSFIEQNEGYFQLGIVAILLVAIFPSLLALGSAFARIKNTHYKVTNQRVLIETGVLSRSLEEIDMRSIDDIEFQQTFLERIFGIGKVYIVSTDKVAPRLELIGIHDPRHTRELIRAAAYQVSQRQLFTRST